VVLHTNDYWESSPGTLPQTILWLCSTFLLYCEVEYLRNSNLTFICVNHFRVVLWCSSSLSVRLLFKPIEIAGVQGIE
jgi:hypothetical protein